MIDYNCVRNKEIIAISFLLLLQRLLFLLILIVNRHFKSNSVSQHEVFFNQVGVGIHVLLLLTLLLKSELT